MSSVHLASPNGTQTVYEEDRARELWTQGAIGPDWLYWREGMSEWRPAAELFPLQAGVAETINPTVSSTTLPPRGFAKDPAGLTKTLVVLIWISVVLAFLSAIVQGIAMGTGQAATLGDELAPLDLVLVLLGLPQLLLYVVTTIVFLMWVYRARKNAEWLGAHGMGFTPGWSVGWYFVPILNLWKPYQAMKEIWQASKDPNAWRAQVPPALLGVWWGLWILDNMLGKLSFRLSFRADTPAELMASAVVSLVSELIGIILCFVAIRLVRSIYQMQQAWAVQPREPRCGICNQSIAPEEMVFLNSNWVCARCKPISLQQIAEGAKTAPGTGSQ